MALQKFQKLHSTSDHVYPMGCAAIDIPIGFGGIRSGKIVEIRALESRGKTTISLEIVFAFGKYWQALGKKFRIKWVETESAFDVVRAIWMNPEIAPLIEIDEAETVEQAHSIIKQFLNECESDGTMGIVIWDTLAAAGTDAQKKKDSQFGGGQMEQARYLRYMFRDLTNLLGKTNCCLILPNQTYQGKPDQWGNQEKVSYGGGAIKYHTSIRLDIKDKVHPIIETQPNGSEIQVGIKVECGFLKNKLTGSKIPFKLCINNEEGVDLILTAKHFLQEQNLITVSGSWKKVQFKDQQITWQTDAQLREKITADPEIWYWFEYLTYDWYSRSSPLVKLRTIDRLWQYEERFFGEKRTQLSEREIVAGEAIEKHFKQEEERLDQDYEEAEEKKTTKKKKVAVKKISTKKSKKKRADELTAEDLPIEE